MHVTRVIIRNYRALQHCDVEFNEGLNIVVADNEAGKSTLLESITLALTGQLNGRPIANEIHPFLFSLRSIEEYLVALRAGKPIEPPTISIEVFFSNIPELAELRGNENSEKADLPGVLFRIEFDEAYRMEYADYIASPNDVRTIPVEYYRPTCFSFSRKQITPRSIPVTPVVVDASRISSVSGANRYVSGLIKEALPVKDQVQLSLSYRKMQDAFLQEGNVKKINAELKARQGVISDKVMSMALDSTTKGGWESGIMPNLDNVPISLVGKGEQNAVKVKLALEKSSDANVFLIEEPENHLSHSRLNQLIECIVEKAGKRQALITTHSSFVLNKLGINNVILFRGGKSIRLNGLSRDTYDYFKKLPGHDTLRLLLSNRSILVEGPSDELVVQKAFFLKNGKGPLQAGVDVISVKSLAFKRFLEIARALSIRVDVVTDNDGDVASLEKKYVDYEGSKDIFIRYDDDEKYPTLEPQMLKANGRDVLNKVLGKDFKTDEELVTYMTKSENKTDVALAIFETEVDLKFPRYISDAIQ